MARHSLDRPRATLGQPSADENYVIRQSFLKFPDPRVASSPDALVPGSTGLGTRLGLTSRISRTSVSFLARRKDSSLVILLSSSRAPLVPDQHLEHISPTCAGTSPFLKSADTPPARQRLK
jgi:hypothetical protein